MHEHQIIDQALETIFSLMVKRLKTKEKESGESKTEIDKGMRSKDSAHEVDMELIRPLVDPEFDKAPVELPKPKRIAIVIGKKASGEAGPKTSSPTGV